MLQDDTTCYRHPEARAAVGCQRCGRPICSNCMAQAPIGHHCPECVAAHGQQVHTPSSLRGSSSRFGVVPVLIGLNVLAFLAQQATTGQVTNDGLLFGPLVAEGELWRIVTSGFLHGSLMHIGFNMYALWIFGKPLEEGLGAVRFLLIYLAGLLGGSLAVLAFNYATPTLGASGAVLGLAGGLAAILWARGVPITQTSFGFIILINLALPLLVPRISFWGHLGGIAAGFVAGWLLAWLPGRFGQSDLVARGATVGLCAVLAAAAVAVGG